MRPLLKSSCLNGTARCSHLVFCFVWRRRRIDEKEKNYPKRLSPSRIWRETHAEGKAILRHSSNWCQWLPVEDEMMKRYDIERLCDRMIEDKNGEWVKFEDMLYFLGIREDELDKFQKWLLDYSGNVYWEEFKKEYFWCDSCKSYQNGYCRWRDMIFAFIATCAIWRKIREASG